LLNGIAKLVSPSDGQILFDGSDIFQWPPDRIARAGLTLVPEGRRLFSRLTVLENLLLGAHFVEPAERNRRFEYVFGLFPVVRSRRKAFAGHLSGGEQQMLAIGRGLMSGPKLLLLDEPSAGLGPLVAQSLYGSVAQYASQGGSSILLVEQNVSLGLSLATRGYVLELGRIRLTGTVSELAADERVAGLYLGRAIE
jgi:branched-chain amino acid transport system ATP-binding protein